LFSSLNEELRRAELPPIRASFFREGDLLYPIALRPFTVRGSGEIAVDLTDALSAFWRVPFRTRRWQPLQFTQYASVGAWDTSGVEVVFEREVAIHGVTGRGEPTGFSIVSMIAPLAFEGRCAGSTIDIKGHATTASWRSSIVAWVGKPAPQGGAAVVVRHVPGANKYKTRVIESVDLNQDGIADFSLWAGLEPEVATTETYWKAVFANVEGKWLLLAFNQEPDCT
jgi:hypothetical protein